MELADVYKLLHQAAMGPEHAVEDPVVARMCLESEMAHAGKGTDEPVADIISPDGRLARIHLRPYLASGHPLGVLADAFLQTAQTYAGSSDKLAKFCNCLGDLAAAGGIPYGREEVERYFASIAERSFPIVHHSQAYRDAYHPAYRVVALEHLPVGVASQP